MSSTTLNVYCPNSGKPVEPDSLTTHRGYEGGFCNPHCRDDFAAEPEKETKARIYFERRRSGSASSAERHLRLDLRPRQGRPHRELG